MCLLSLLYCITWTQKTICRTGLSGSRATFSKAPLSRVTMSTLSSHLHLLSEITMKFEKSWTIHGLKVSVFCHHRHGLSLIQSETSVKKDVLPSWHTFADRSPIKWLHYSTTCSVHVHKLLTVWTDFKRRKKRWIMPPKDGLSALWPSTNWQIANF